MNTEELRGDGYLRRDYRRRFWIRLRLSLPYPSNSPLRLRAGCTKQDTFIPLTLLKLYKIGDLNSFRAIQTARRAD